MTDIFTRFDIYTVPGSNRRSISHRCIQPVQYRNYENFACLRTELEKNRSHPNINLIWSSGRGVELVSRRMKSHDRSSYVTRTVWVLYIEMGREAVDLEEAHDTDEFFGCPAGVRRRRIRYPNFQCIYRQIRYFIHKGFEPSKPVSNPESVLDEGSATMRNRT